MNQNQLLILVWSRIRPLGSQVDVEIVHGSGGSHAGLDHGNPIFSETANGLCLSSSHHNRIGIRDRRSLTIPSDKSARTFILCISRINGSKCRAGCQARNRGSYYRLGTLLLDRTGHFVNDHQGTSCLIENNFKRSVHIGSLENK